MKCIIIIMFTAVAMQSSGAQTCTSAEINVPTPIQSSASGTSHVYMPLKFKE